MIEELKPCPFCAATACNRRAQQQNEPLTEENGKKFALQVIAKGTFIDHVEQSNFIVETAVIRLNPAALNGWILSDMTNTRECYEDGPKGDKQWEAHKVEYAERRKSWEAQVVNALGIDINSDRDSISITQAQSEIFTVVHIRETEGTTAPKVGGISV